MEKFYYNPLNYPNQSETGFRIIADRTSNYNCISFALGITNKWIIPELAETKAISMGYNEVELTDIDHYQHVIAVFGFHDNVSHMAKRSLKGGDVWHSKLGHNYLVEHKLGEIQDSIYGNLIKFYAK